MSASIHKAVFQFNSKVRPFQPAANETVWQFNLISVFGKFRFHKKGYSCSEISFRRSLSSEARWRCSWMKTFVSVSMFTWNCASDCKRVHVSVTIKYTKLLMDLVDYLAKLWSDFARRLSAKHHTAVSRSRTYQRTYSGASYERQPVIMGQRPQEWRRDDSETKQKSFKICPCLTFKWIAITFYIIQFNWLSMDYNLVSLSLSEAPMA